MTDPLPTRRRGGGARLWRWTSLLWRRLTPQEHRGVGWLVVITILSAAFAAGWPTLVPLSVLTVPMLLGSLFLGPRQLPWFVIFTLIMLSLPLSRHDTIPPSTVRVVVVMFLLGLIVLVASFRRTSLGVGGATGESMLVDLRDRINRQGVLPPLPDGWYAESALRSAGGSPFAGDFLVATRPGDRPTLEVAVVDVSGKGEQAGTRALLLSGAFGGLIGALPAGRFLPAANDYLLRQDWDEGFATAVHLSLDLVTGAFEIRSAGHPPAVQRQAGSGRWLVHESEGPVLGLMEDGEFAVVKGMLRHGDAVLLYTDGMVETRKRDIGLGIDKLVGQAERMMRKSFHHGAQRLIDTLGSRNDDRALLLIHRR